QATVGQTSQGTWVGWTVVPEQVWDSSRTTVSCKRDHGKTKGDRAAVETVGEISDVSQGTGGEEAGESCDSTTEKDGESEGIGRRSYSSVRRLRRSRLDDTSPHVVSECVHHKLCPCFRSDRKSLCGTPGQ